MSVKVIVAVDLKPLERYVKLLSVSGQIGWDQVMIRWLVRYKKFAKARFNANSAGGGAWPPLKPNTRKRVRKRSRAILKDSDVLSHTLDPIPTLARYPMAGIATYTRRNGVTITFGGTGKHPYSKLSVARLAKVHHLGLGRVPTREILISPSDEIKRFMVNDLRQVANETKRFAGLT